MFFPISSAISLNYFESENVVWKKYVDLTNMGLIIKKKYGYKINIITYKTEKMVTRLILFLITSSATTMSIFYLEYTKIDVLHTKKINQN